MGKLSCRLKKLAIVSLLSNPRRSAVGALLALLLLPLTCVAATRLPEELRESVPAGSIIIEDRDGRPLREVRASDGTRARWVSLRDVKPATVRAILAAEDARFYEHPGVDPARARPGRDPRRLARTRRLRRFDADDAARAPPAAAPANRVGQAARDGPRAADRGVALEGRDPRAVREPRELRAQPARHRGGQRRILRQVAPEPLDRRVGVACRAAARSVALPADAPSGAGAPPARSRPRPHERPRLDRRR